MRPAFDALFAIDDAMADAALGTREPALAAIKLAWWREQLQALDHAPPPAEPRLQAAADQLIARGVSGQRLSMIEDGWLALLDPAPDRDQVATRGDAIFAAGASLLGGDADVGQEGRAWALADLARRTGERSWLDPSIRLERRVGRKLRPLTALSVLALRDHRRGVVEPEGTPARAWTLLRHRFTGRP